MEMKMKNKGSKHRYGSELKSSATFSFKFFLRVFCFTLLPLHLLTSLVDAAPASSASQAGQELPHSSFALPKDPNSQVARALWRAEISIAKGQRDNRSKTRLKRIIEQIRSVELKPQKRTPEPVVVPEKTPAAEPNETVSETPVPKEDEKRHIEVRLPYKPITGQTLQMLRNLSQHPDKLDNPLELGEILFLSGNLKEAAIFYQEALNRTSADDTRSAQERAWILFQLGNCLRNDDLPAAAKRYGQLITEYPNSPWAGLAQAQGQLIGWYLKDEPRKLIAEMEHVGREQGQNE